jgi:hypothetical protein
MNKFDKFMRSKNGKYIAIGALVLLVILAIVIGGGLGTGGLTGTAGVPTNPTYEMPKDGYTCLPTCVENDAKMFILAGSNQASLSNTPIKVWIMVPGDQPTFTLGIFDGDTGKDINNTLQLYPSGYINSGNGNWDDAWSADTTYTLYADPLADGSGQVVLDSWLGNEVMLNNAWWETTINRDEQAKAPNGHYYYRLDATRPLDGIGGQAFKVRASGYLMTGQRQEWSVGLAGAVSTLNDIKIVYPESNGNTTKLGSQSTYNGDWQMYFDIPSNVQKFEIWDGDFDRGTVSSPDTDDPNSEGKPSWATKFAVDERAGGAGKPNDDNSTNYFRVSPSVTYEILDPLGQPIYTNNDPSGTEEWEKYTISVNLADNPDFPASETLKAGMYNIHIKGLDLHNAIWVGVNYPICPTGNCPPPVWVEASCPRTIGYWKNNVKKIYGQGKTNGVQESKETLDWGLRNTALASKLFRNGIDVNAPSAIENPISLTPAEANDILQKTGKGNSMLARALQQNLAAWLNLSTGKIGPNSQIEITNIAGGPFSGTMMEALRYAEDIILDPAKRADAQLLERAKDIADMINNNALTTDASEDNADTLACSAYEKGSVPKDKQPPSHDKLPKAPKPTPVPVTPAPPSEDVCTTDTNLGQGFTILAVNPEGCLGEQNGLLFHGTATTRITGNAFSNGCLRSAGTHSVEVTNGLVEYVVENFGDMTLINPLPEQVAEPVTNWQIAAPDCDDPAAIQMDGKDIKGDSLLFPGLYCISGDVTVNAHDTLAGSGITLYFIDGGLHINGNALVNLTAPFGDGVSPALPGVLIYVPGANGNGQQVQINGNSDSYFSGIIYAPGSEMELLGTGNTIAYRSQFIGWDVRVGGTADLLIDWDGTQIPACIP